MHKKANLLFIIPFEKSFIQRDIDLLADRFVIKKLKHNWTLKYLTPIFMFAQFFQILLFIRTYDRIVIHFGGYWAFVPSLLGWIFNVPVYIVLHGTDCASLPQVSYGNLRKKLLKTCSKMSYSLATCLLPVSKSLIYTKNIYNGQSDIQGIHHHFPFLTTPFKVIHNELDQDFWNYSLNTKKEENRFIAVFSENQFELKGGDLIFKLAQKLPHCKFYIAGYILKESVEIPINIIFLGKLSKYELREHYRISTFHFQLSMFEGFGLALCEAMLCGCIPITSSVNIIPEIVGETGFILEKRNIDKLVDLVNYARSREDKLILGQNARERIISKFAKGSRYLKLTETLKI